MALTRRRPPFLAHKRHIGSYRYWLYGFNLVLLIVLFAFVSITCKILHKDRMYLFPLEHSEPLVLYLFCGPFLQLVDILTGLIGVWRQRTILLTCYWWFLLAILLCDLVIGILWIFRWRSLHSLTGQYFLDGLANLHDSPDFCRRWNSVQSELSCCGVYSFTDWNRIGNFCQEDLGNGTRLPDSCCGHLLHGPMATLCGHEVPSNDGSTASARLPGCRDALIKWLYHQSNIVFLLGICVVVFLKVVGLVIMRTEIRQLGDEIFAMKNRDAILAQPKFSVDLSPFCNNVRHEPGLGTSRSDTANGSLANMDHTKETIRLVVTDCHGVDKDES